MKKLTRTALATALLVTGGVASAENMYIDVGDTNYESSPPNITDPNSTTGIFDEFGFNQVLATSIYDYTDGSVFGAFYDSNVASELNFAGLPAAGIALDGVTPVSLTVPSCPGPQCDIDALSPLSPPLVSDSEGFLLTWDLQMEYHFDGTLTAGGPNYTGGYLDIYFNDLINDANDRKVVGLTLTGSDVQLTNLNLFFDITFAEDDFLWIDDGTGTFIDAHDGTVSGDFSTAVLDTNVDPAIPTPDQLLLLTDGNGDDNVIRQTHLDGSITAAIPEPGTVAMMGLGLLGLGASVARRRRTK